MDDEFTIKIDRILEKYKQYITEETLNKQLIPNRLITYKIGME